jgi:polar amino acid transport system permease protein
MTSNWDWSFAERIVPDLLRGLLTTVELTAVASAIALTLGLLVAVVRVARIPVVSAVCTVVMEFLRGTPILVQAYFAFYVLPKYGLQWSAFLTGSVVLGVNYSAYTSEVYRAGIQRVDRGQWEASAALSLPWRRRWQAVVLPQALRASIPALGNYVIAMFKESAILSAITVTELLSQAQTLGSATFRYVEPLTIAALLYLIVSYPCSLAIRRFERHLAHGA